MLIAFTIRALYEPMRLAETLAQLNLVQSSFRSFATSALTIMTVGDTIGRELSQARKVCEVGEIPNVVQDSTKSFPSPEDAVRLHSEVALEFR